MITYKPFRENVGIPVLLDGRRCGTIQQTKGGWRYMPSGGKIGGEVFGSVDRVKAEIE